MNFLLEKKDHEGEDPIVKNVLIMKIDHDIYITKSQTLSNLKQTE